jgi:hypothetical protein
MIFGNDSPKVFLFLLDSQASLIFLHACCGLISKQIAAKQYTEIVHKISSSSTEFLTEHNGLKFLNILCYCFIYWTSLGISQWACIYG